MNINFQEIATTATKSGVCPICGKRVVRRQRFWQTDNPWNRNDDGTVKTRDEIYADVKAEADAWVPDFTHAKCAVLS